MRRRPKEHWRRIRTRLGRFWKKINKGINYGSDISDKLKREQAERQFRSKAEIYRMAGINIYELPKAQRESLMYEPPQKGIHKISEPTPSQMEQTLKATGTQITPTAGLQAQRDIYHVLRRDDPYIAKLISEEYKSRGSLPSFGNWTSLGTASPTQMHRVGELTARIEELKRKRPKTLTDLNVINDEIKENQDKLQRWLSP